MKSSLMDGMSHRPFAYSDIFRHPPMSGDSIPPELAAIRKNESSCVVILPDGTWLVTWSQGSSENAPDEQVVMAKSQDCGLTWSEPRRLMTSTKKYRRSYGAPFVAPDSGRLFFFIHEGVHAGDGIPRNSPEVDVGKLAFIYSDDSGDTWSDFRSIELPDRDINMFPDRIHGHINHPPQIMPNGQVLLPFSQYARPGSMRRDWQLVLLR